MERSRAARKGGKKYSGTADSVKSSKVAMNTVSYDTDLYDSNGVDKFNGYNTSIAVHDGDVEMEDVSLNGRNLVAQYTATREQMDELAGAAPEPDILMSREQQAQIQSRQTAYQKRQYDRQLEAGDAAPGRSYREIMAEKELEREEARVAKAIHDKKVQEDEMDVDHVEHEPTLKFTDGDKENHETTNGAEAGKMTEEVTPARKKRSRWGAPEDSTEPAAEEDGEASAPKKRSRWGAAQASPEAEEIGAPKKRSRFDDTSAALGAEAAASPSAEAAAASKPRGRWDIVSAVGSTPAPGGRAVAAPAVGFGSDISARNAILSDEDLDRLLPGPDRGYEILTPPPGFEPPPGRAPARSLVPAGAPQPFAPMGFMQQNEADSRALAKSAPTDIPGVGDLQFFKPEDEKYFGKLAENVNETELGVGELKERKIMRLLLKIKNGTPPMRKTALRQITDNARAFGAKALFDQILPLLMEKTLEDQERHLLVKVVDRILYKLDELVRPFTHKILVVIEPLLIDQDYYARVEGREIISNLAKAAGLAHMISVMRPDIDHADEYVRNTTARAFAVVASALSIPALLPFLRAVCRSKKSWQARHTGVKIVQQCAILMGCAVLPHLKELVHCIGENLNDEQTKVRTVTALAIAALAEAAAPYGIESFDDILQPLWNGARKQKGKTLTGFVKAVGFVIQLMDEEYANYYTSQIMEILKREFASPDEEMKKVVLKVLSQCASNTGVTAEYLKKEVLSSFFANFWVRRMAMDRRNYRQVVDTTVDLGKKVGTLPILSRIIKHLKDENESFRKMTVETVEKVVTTLGVVDIQDRDEEVLIDGLIYSFSTPGAEDQVFLNAFGTVAAALGERMDPYIAQISGTILQRLTDGSPAVRQQACDLISQTAKVIAKCGQYDVLTKITQGLYERFGEEYPEVLGSVLGAMRSVVSVIGIHQVQPSISTILPALTPILRNRHEKVQENAVDLVGRIADRGPDSVSGREWMRVCFELLDMLKAHKKGIRRASNNTFGFIAKAVGPSDVLDVLLNNLRVTERQSRVCSAVAIGIVAETCSPYTVIPSLMSEYRVPELNVQNGVLKALSFLFEYIGEMGKDYVYAVTPLLEDALIDRDQVHRQTAASVVKHIALGVVGLGCEDALVHMLNLLMPNIFETSPHVIDRIIEGIDAIRNAVGTGLVMNYVWAGLFHPARRVRQPYWRLYNECYVQSADAMVPYYPELGDPRLKRNELYVVI